MLRFEYRRIGRRLVQDVLDTVCRSESVLLLGPRFSGKRYVLNKLSEALRESSGSQVVFARFLRAHPIVSPGDVSDLFAEQAGFGTVSNPDERLLGPLERCHDATGKQIILLAANVDGLAHSLARRLLYDLRNPMEEGRIVAVLSGEDDFHRLMQSPNSPVNCARQFVLQGFDPEEFAGFCERYGAALNVSDKDIPGGWARLHALTGGHTGLMRTYLWDIVESRVRPTGAEAPDPGARYTGRRILGSYGSHIFRHAIQIINRDPEAWSPLQELLVADGVLLPSDSGAPTALELSGVAVRNGSVLQFASPMMQQFCERYYDSLRLGDLCARRGRWDDAFRYYQQLAPERTVRPLDADDREDTELALRALISKIYSMITGEVEDPTRAKLEMQRHLVSGCHYLLGFSHVTFWHWDGEWRQMTLDERPIPQQQAEGIIAFLPTTLGNVPGPLLVPDPHEQFAVATLLRTQRSDEMRAVVIGDFQAHNDGGSRLALSPDRRQLANQLLSHFTRAWSQLAGIEEERTRKASREQHVKIINSIYAALGRQVRDVRNALVIAGRELCASTYRRILFCLLDTKEERLIGVIEAEQGTIRPADKQVYPVADADSDLQGAAIRSRESCIFPDRYGDAGARERKRLGPSVPFAIIPILGPLDTPIGTIRVERSDGTEPTREECEDLEAFGRQLAVAIDQSERFNLLLTVLNQIPEPIYLIYPARQATYANEKANELFEVPSGWQSCDAFPVGRLAAEHFPQGLQAGKVAEQFLGALETGEGSVQHLSGLGEVPDYYGAVLTAAIRDFRDEIAGALLHVQDLSYLKRVLEAFRVVGAAPNQEAAFDAMIEAVKRLGHRWGRLYVADSREEPRALNLHCWYPPDPRLDHGVVLKRGSQGEYETWQCVDQERPIVFCYGEHEPTGARVPIRNGKIIGDRKEGDVQAYNLNPPVCPESLKKAPGDIWIDVPLVVSDATRGRRIVGKFTLEYAECLKLEDFELLKVFGELSAGLIDTLADKERALRKSADEALENVAHSLLSPIKSYSFFVKRFRSLESACPLLAPVIDDFEEALSELKPLTRRVQDLLGTSRITPSDVELCSLLKRVLRLVLPPDQFEVSPSDELVISADELQLKLLFDELVRNSLKFKSDQRELIIRVNVERSRENECEWVRITFSDNGSGIASRDRHRIFQQYFYQHEGQEGSGLGLALVWRIVEAHGGRVSVEDQDVGACFLVILPAGERAIQHEGEDQENVPNPAG